jgi:membrane protease YdiL (CAAX protease family)
LRGRDETLGGRLLAVGEVALAFALMHVAFRAFKRFTALGRLEYEHEVNFAPGAAMLIVAGAFMLARRSRPAEYGITARPLRPGLNAGLAALAVYAAVGAVAVACGLRRDSDWGAAYSVIVAALSLVVAALTLWVLWRWGRVIERIPAWIGIAAVIGAPLLPVVARVAHGKPVGHTVATVLWIVLGAAIAEELFFRGYVQSRLNEAFGRRLDLLGVRFGPGLFIAAGFFGLVHVLNTYDYFTGSGRLNWWHGVAAASTLFYGLLRERTGGIAAPVIVHGCVDLAGHWPALMAAP